LKEDVDAADYPTIEQRLALSADMAPFYTKPAALMGRDTLFNYTECLTACIRLRTAAKINLFFHMLCSTGGLLMMFYLNFVGRNHVVPGMMFVFMSLFLVPVLIMSLWSNRD
jgi:hypothetical protein